MSNTRRHTILSCPIRSRLSDAKLHAQMVRAFKTLVQGCTTTDTILDLEEMCPEIVVEAWEEVES